MSGGDFQPPPSPAGAANGAFLSVKVESSRLAIGETIVGEGEELGETLCDMKY